MKTKQMILIGVLGVAGIAFIVDRIFLGEPATADASVADVAPRVDRTPRAAEPKTTEVMDPSLPWLEKLPDGGHVTRDVFALPPSLTEREPDTEMEQERERERARLDLADAFLEAHQLDGTFISDGAPMAVINGRVRRQGEIVDGFRITRIEPHRVHLRRGDQHVSLALPIPTGSR